MTINMNSADAEAVDAFFADLRRATAPSRPPHAEQIEALRRFASIHANPPKFSVGDIVTPTVDGGVKYAGEPHVVLARLLDVDLPETTAGIFGTPMAGIRLDLLVGFVRKSEGGDGLLPLIYRVASWQFEPYVAVAEGAGEVGDSKS